MPPAAVEITLLQSEAADSLIVCFVNYQDSMPNIPIPRIQARIALPFKVDTANAKPISGQIAVAKAEQGALSIEVSNLETLAVIVIPI